MSLRAVILALIPMFWTGPVLAVESTYETDWSESVSTNTGMMNYTMEGAVSESGTLEGSNTANVGLEWAHFFKKDLATLVGYRVAWSSESERTQYQAASLGLRMFPFTLGVPVSSFRALSLVEYNFPFKPYFDAGLVTGRYLITTLFDQDVGDVSSEFIGFFGAMGMQYAITQRYAVDTRVAFEYDKQYGPIEFQATTLYVLLGMSFYL